LCPYANCVNYDAENRQIFFAGDTYVYDGDGQRVSRKRNDGTTVYVYDISGQVAAEYQSGTLNTPPCSTCYLTVDNLGSTRMVTDQNLTVISRHDYMPFGEEIIQGYAGRSSQFGSGDNVTLKFTGKQRDTESGLDYFGARYYGSALGRFTSPDWSPRQEPVPYADFENPQTLNLYTYGNNNPLKNRDLDGHCTVDGEQHFGWCIWHTLGFYQTEKEQADTARQALSPMHGFTINGQTPAEIAQNGTNQEVIAAQRTAIEILAGEGMRLCAPGVSCGVVVPPVGGGTAWVRVGRWMSTEELGEMQASGVAQEKQGAGGFTCGAPCQRRCIQERPRWQCLCRVRYSCGSCETCGFRLGENPRA
jgi:RHS repeat-associated protein